MQPHARLPLTEVAESPIGRAAQSLLAAAREDLNDAAHRARAVQRTLGSPVDFDAFEPVACDVSQCDDEPKNRKRPMVRSSGWRSPSRDHSRAVLVLNPRTENSPKSCVTLPRIA